MTSKFRPQLFRNAHVEVTSLQGQNRHGVPYSQAQIVVDGKREHIFPTESRVSKALSIMTPKQLGERLSGGHFFFVDDSLVDFRDGHYNGFVMDNEGIKQLVRQLGITDTREFGKSAGLLKGNTHAGHILLGKMWSQHDIVVPGYQTGGEFYSRLIFIWNPFVRTVNTLFSLVRVTCGNGMIGVTSFLNTRVPIINRWEEHLEIANRQMQNKVHTVAMTRFVQMGQERATVGEITQVLAHASERREKSNEAGRSTEAELLGNIIKVLNPYYHLRKVYATKVFSDKRLSAQMPGHLTTFDVFNAATEVRSHTTPTDKSTTLALDRFANRILFDREDLVGHPGRFTAPPESVFSNVNQAFFGQIIDAGQDIKDSKK